MRIRSVFALCAAAAFLLEACSGGGGTFSPPGLSTSGTPTPPAGGAGNVATQITQSGSIQLPVPPPGAISGFTVENSLGTALVRPNGSFSVTAFTGAQFTTVNNSNGTPELLALLGPSETQINVHTTAEALVYFSGGLFMLPEDQRQQVYQSLGSAPGFSTLESAVSAALAADANALVDGNVTISTAVRNFIASLTPASVGHMPAQIAPQDILVQEPSKQSGVTVLNTQPVQIRFMNEKRRLARAYVDEVSVGRSDGTHTQIFDLPVSDVVPPIDIPSTTSLKSFTGTVSDIFAGNYAWTPVTTDPVTLTSVANSLWTRYNVTVVGEGIGVAPGLTGEQQAGLVSMRMQNFLWNFALPGISGLLLPYNRNPFGGALSPDDANAIKGLIDEINTDIPTIYPLISNGSYKDAMIQLVGAFANNAPLRNGVIRFIGGKFKLDDSEIQELIGKSSANAVLAAVDGVLTGIDLAATLKDALTSHPVETFTVYAVPTKIIVTPASATINNDQQVSFAVNVPSAAGSELQLTYTWQNPAQNGHLTPLSNLCQGPMDNFACSAGDIVIYKSNIQGSGTDKMSLTLKAIDSSGNKIQTITLGQVDVPVTVTSTPSPSPSPSPPPNFGTPPFEIQSGCGPMSISPHLVRVGETITGTTSAVANECNPGGGSNTWRWNNSNTLPTATSGCHPSDASCSFTATAATSGWVSLCINGSAPLGTWISCDYYGVIP